uniref:Uncharacterized protein n=1 Tax=viral metagenome TaxID=1070528 RepID=A0A6C0AF73_9ZZZZ
MNEFSNEYDLFITNLKNKLKKLSTAEKRDFLLKLDILSIKKNCLSKNEQEDFLIFILKYFLVFSGFVTGERFIDENNYINVYTIYRNEEEINTEKEEEFIKSFLEGEISFRPRVYSQFVGTEKERKCCIIS